MEHHALEVPMSSLPCATSIGIALLLGQIFGHVIHCTHRTHCCLAQEDEACLVCPSYVADAGLHAAYAREAKTKAPANKLCEACHLAIAKSL